MCAAGCRSLCVVRCALFAVGCALFVIACLLCAALLLVASLAWCVC